ncbi:LAME_0D04830g1_1 [Lachancea meyersii CBS 8951]|uniref:LAME_0D04830g1_1 n=1 Tax=Lachancea meyersii CBS 8951 TaxID=1266667 RepID=A0A1G4J8J0_9SACH|nr:LAME_0D04830g1_1 [Lachancea meyersii CBS 8951]
MYRGRNRPRGKASEDNQVRGPNSALTQFLKEQGINAESIRQKWLKSREKDKEESNGKVKSEDEDESVSIAKPATKSRRRAIEISSDDDDDDDIDYDDESEEAEGDSMTSGVDNDENKDQVESSASIRSAESRLKRFAVDAEDSDEAEYDEGMSSRTVSETPVIEISQEQLEQKLKKSRQQLQQRKRKKKRAAELLDRKTRRISTLQDTCIAQISANISRLQQNTNSSDESISAQIRDTLGGLSTQNMNKLARTLSKNRALNDHTLQLFLRTELQTLAFHDCSRLSYEGYKLLAIFAPHLSELSLQMCGQLNNEALLYIAEKLPKLAALDLDGPFLINEETWDRFFTRMRGRLKSFHVSNTHRFTNHSLESLFRNCGDTLVSLRLCRLDDVSDYSIIPRCLKVRNFERLALEHPSKEEYVTDDVVGAIVTAAGRKLKHLNLNGCTALTDTTIVNLKEALSKNEGAESILESLELEELDQISTDAMVHLFSQVPMPQLKVCSLKRCLLLEDMAVTELFLNKAGEKLVALTLNSLKEVKGECFEAMSCPNLERLDIGFMGCANDTLVKELGDRNPKLEILEVFGNNLVTGKAEIRSGLTVIGRQSDTL